MSHPTVMLVGGTYRTEFQVYDPENAGQVKAPDSLPTATVTKDGIATGDSVTIAAAATGANGHYKLSYTPSGALSGNTYVIRITSLISTVSYPEVIAFVVLPATVDANVVSMANGVMTANAIAAAALNGKGDWNTVTPDNAGISSAAVAAANAESAATSAASASTTAAVAAASAASSASAAATDTTSILAKMGAFAGTGLNTILGFLLAIMRKDVSVPGNVGGTFASSTDSLEAQAEAVAALGSLGSGPYSVAITVVDEDGAPVPNAHVSLTAVGQTIRSGTTDGDGICPPFSSDGSIDWTVAITAGGGLTFTPVTLSVASANVVIEYEMVASPLAQPDDPSLISHNVLCTGTNGLKEPGAIVRYRLVDGTGNAGAGQSRDTGETEATANANGLATLTFIIGCTYEIRRGTIGRVARYVASATTPPETLGAP